MKTRKFPALLGVLVLLAGSVLADQASAFSRGPKAMTAEQAGAAGNDFAWDLYRNLRLDPGNLFFSPASIDLALVMAWTGARGQTAQDMGRALHLDPRHAGLPELVSAAYGELQNSIAGGDGPFTLRIANRLWGQAGFDFLPTFLHPLQKDFGAGLQPVNFATDSEGARQTINAWVEQETEGKIQDLLAQGSLGSDVRLVLTNAIYFLGQWQHQFQGGDTRDDVFHLLGGQDVAVPTMHQTRRFPYTEDDMAQVLAMPYQGGEVEMLIALPRPGQVLADLEKSLDSEVLDRWVAGRQERTVAVAMPRFSLSGEFSLARILGRMGMASAFSSLADFSGMASGGDLFISEVVHKSFVDVYEKGTEAAAATAVTIRLTSMPGGDPDQVVFSADHPFLFMIRHVTTNQILFLGRVMDPRG
jgi:serpin B